MIITIDKAKELTRKEYVEFMKVTKGETISESRISQLVAAGKLNVRDYPELNGLQLIVLDEEEQALAKARFITTQPVHSYSYKELGLMFANLFHDLNGQVGNANTLLTEKQAQIDQLASTLEQTQAELNQAYQANRQLQEQLNQLTHQLQQREAQLTELTGQLEKSQAENAGLVAQVATLQQKLETESALRAEFNDFKQMVMTLLAQKTPSKRKPKP